MKVLICFLLLIACSTHKQTSDFETVSFNSSEDSELKIDETQAELYAPNGKPIENTVGDKKAEREAIVSLSIYSSIYSSLALVELFKQLEKEQINISVINANGFAAVVAAIYAKEKSSNSLEWKLFALLKRIKGMRPYNKDWTEEIISFLEDEFGKMKLEKLKISLKIPRLVNDKMQVAESGLVVKVLSENLDLSSKDNYFKKPAIYNRNLMKYSSDLNFNIVFIPSEVKFKIIDGYSWGLMTNYLGFVLKNPEKIYQIKTDKKIAIDELLPLSEINNAYSEGVSAAMEKFKLSLKTWKEEITASSN